MEFASKQLVWSLTEIDKKFMQSLDVLTAAHIAAESVDAKGSELFFNRAAYLLDQISEQDHAGRLTQDALDHQVNELIVSLLRYRAVRSQERLDEGFKDMYNHTVTKGAVLKYDVREDETSIHTGFVPGR